MQFAAITDQTYESLLDTVEKARQIYERTHALFCSVASRTRQLPRFPTGLAQPPDNHPLRDAFAAEREAERQYTDALNRLNRHIAGQTTAHA